jgi:hypothetical protein
VKIHTYLPFNSGPGSSVGIATDYGLDGSGIESLTAVRGVHNGRGQRVGWRS